MFAEKPLLLQKGLFHDFRNHHYHSLTSRHASVTEDGERTAPLQNRRAHGVCEQSEKPASGFLQRGNSASSHEPSPPACKMNMVLVGRPSGFSTFVHRYIYIYPKVAIQHLRELHYTSKLVSSSTWLGFLLLSSVPGFLPPLVVKVDRTAKTKPQIKTT